MDKYVSHPTKKTLLLFIFFWILATGLTLAAMTDFFSESPFEAKDWSGFFWITVSFFAVCKVYRNYKKTNGHKKDR